MHRDESDELDSCANCGADIAAGPDRGYRYGNHGVICWSCAVERGGSYDADKDAWTTAPDVMDLPDERRPHS